MVCLSGWLPHRRAGPASASALQLGWEIPAEVSGTPTLCCHGLADAVVTPALSELSCAALTEAGYTSPGCSSHSDTTLYISLVILHTKYTGARQNDFNVHA